MNLGQAIGSGCRQNVNFEGRSSRAGFSDWQLFLLIVNFAIEFMVGLGGSASGSTSPAAGMFAGVLVIFSLATFLPSLAVLVRRLHDTGKSGWWYFIAL